MNVTKLSLSSSELSSLADILLLVLNSQYVSAETDPKYANYLLLLEIVSSLTSSPRVDEAESVGYDFLQYALKWSI